MSWPTASLGDVCRVVSGATPRTGVAEYWDGEILWATPKDLSGLKSLTIGSTAQKITEAGYKSSSTEILPANSVLLSSRAPIGYVAVNTVPMCTNQGFKSLVPNQQKVESRFLYFWLRSKRSYLNSLGNGATFKELSKATVERVEIPLPPLPEQQRIAAILEKADALRQKRREALAHLDRLPQALFVEMFGDPVLNPKDWPVSNLGASLSFLTSGSRGWATYYADSGKTFLRIQNVGRGRLNLDDLAYVNAPDSAEARRTRVRPGDILFSITADLGRSAVVPEWMDEAYINQHLAILRSPNTNPVYLSAYLSSPAGQRQVQGLNKGGVKAGLNFDDIRSFQILSPPLDLQKRYACIVERVEALRTREKAFVVDADAVFTSLQSRAFAGEL